MQRAWLQTGSKVKIVFTLASSQFDEVSFDSLDEYIDQAMGAADLLNALLYGGTVQGYDVPSIDQICDGLRMLDQGLHDLKTGLSILSEGGSFEGQDVPGLDTSVAGLEGLAEGVGQLSDGMSDLQAGTYELATGPREDTSRGHTRDEERHERWAGRCAKEQGAACRHEGPPRPVRYLRREACRRCERTSFLAEAEGSVKQGIEHRSVLL